MPGQVKGKSVGIPTGADRAAVDARDADVGMRVGICRKRGGCNRWGDE